MSTEFENQMQAVINERWNHNNALLVRPDTPATFLEVGLADLPMLLTGRHLLSALGDPSASVHPHNIAPEVLATLPELLEHPALILETAGRPDGIAIMTSARDQNGMPIVAAVSTGGRGTIDGKPTECNFITSVFGANHYKGLLYRATEESDVLYADKNLLSEFFRRPYLDKLLPGEDQQLIRESHNVQRFDLTADDAPARYFIDMDGTLAQFHAEENYLERMTEPGFFENLRPYEQMIAKLKDYMKAHPDSEFFVLSGLTADAPDCEGQKNRWLDKYLSEIDAAHRIFTENGDDKSLYIPGGVHARDILIDDYNKNLEDWLAAGGAAVKFVNQVNDRALRGKRWTGERIRYDNPKDIPQTLGRLAANRSSKDVLRKELQNKVAEIVASYRQDPGQIAEFLKFATRFSDYSPNNTRLIMLQNPGAQFVASAKNYKNGLPDQNGNRLTEEPINIKRGEKALYIWKPTVKTQVEVKGAWKNIGDLTEEETAAYRAGLLQTRDSRHFVLVPVFDVTQTTLPPDKYPELFAFGAPSESAEDMVTALSAYSGSILECPVQVENFRGAATSIRGLFNPNLNVIKLSDKLSGEEKLSTLIHEIGHASLHADISGSSGKSTAQIELEADMYALMVQHHCGIEITDSRKAHLAEHYKKWIQELPEADRESINADMPVFRNVCQRYSETVPTVDQFIENYAIGLRAEREQQAMEQLPTEEQVSTVDPGVTAEQPDISVQTEQTDPAQDTTPKKTWNISI